MPTVADVRTFMFTWNPLQGRPGDFADVAEQFAKGEIFYDDWSAGRRKDLPVGSRFLCSGKVRSREES